MTDFIYGNLPALELAIDIVKASGNDSTAEGLKAMHHELSKIKNTFDERLAAPSKSASAQQACGCWNCYMCQGPCMGHAPAPPATAPTDGPQDKQTGFYTMDAAEVLFLASRLRRLFAYFQYKLPEWAKNDQNLIGIAPTCIGAVLSNVNSSWVSVEQRLPTVEGYYLCSIDTDEGATVQTLWFDAAKKHWIHEDEPTFCKSFLFNPTHWQDAPKPYSNY